MTAVQTGLNLRVIVYSARLRRCGPSGPQPLSFWQFYAPAPQLKPAAKKQKKWFEDLVAAWNSTHRQQVELVYVPQPAYLNGAKLPTAFAAGDGPDIFIPSPGDFLRYYNGALTDLTPHLSKKAIADFQPGTLETRTVDGRGYGLPMEVEPMAMFYSLDAFEAAHLAEGDIPKTWDQLLNVGEKLKSAGKPGLVFEVEPGYCSRPPSPRSPAASR